MHEIQNNLLNVYAIQHQSQCMPAQKCDPYYIGLFLKSIIIKLAFMELRHLGPGHIGSLFHVFPYKPVFKCIPYGEPKTQVALYRFFQFPVRITLEDKFVRK